MPEDPNSPTGDIPLTCNVGPQHSEADVVLTENDVPGAKLPKPNPEQNYVKDLKRWLVCHGQDPQGNKTVLIAR